MEVPRARAGKANVEGKKKWQTEHRTATTAYPCYLPILGEFSRSWSCRFAGAKIVYSGSLHKTCRNKSAYGSQVRGTANKIQSFATLSWLGK